VSVYDQVLAVSKTYLGPAAEKFIQRQCKNIKTEPLALVASNMEQLAWFSKNAASLYMEESKATEYAKKIASLK
jgi:hypothetical protein